MIRIGYLGGATLRAQVCDPGRAETTSRLCVLAEVNSQRSSLNSDGYFEFPSDGPGTQLVWCAHSEFRKR